MSIKIAEMIYQCRTDAHLTQKRLAEKASVNLMSLGRWERGVVCPSADNLDKLLKTCGYELKAVKKE